MIKTCKFSKSEEDGWIITGLSKTREKDQRIVPFEQMLKPFERNSVLIMIISDKKINNFNEHLIKETNLPSKAEKYPVIYLYNDRFSSFSKEFLIDMFGKLEPKDIYIKIEVAAESKKIFQDGEFCEGDFDFSLHYYTSLSGTTYLTTYELIFNEFKYLTIKYSAMNGYELFFDDKAKLTICDLPEPPSIIELIKIINKFFKYHKHDLVNLIYGDEL